MFWCFDCKPCGILAPRPGIEPTPPALEGKVLTTGLPGKFLKLLGSIPILCFSKVNHSVQLTLKRMGEWVRN